MNMLLRFVFHKIAYQDSEFKICDMQLPASVFEAIKWIAKWSKVRKDMRFGEIFRNMTFIPLLYFENTREL